MVGPDLSVARVYTSFDGLSRLKGLAAQATPEALQEAADQFEAVFVNLLLKQMRKTTLGEGFFKNDNTGFYTGIMDAQIALNISKQRSLGIADMIVQRLQRYGRDSHDKTAALEPVFFNAIGRAQDHGGELRQQMVAPNFNSPQEFIDVIKPHAEIAARKLGVPAKILVAQAALETAWGKKIIKNSNGESTFNLLGIKANEKWLGASVGVTTLEYIDGTVKKEHARFRSYNSFQHSFDDYVDFIRSNNRYSKVFRHNDGEYYIRALQEAGYATDPEYAEKIISIVKNNPI